MRKVSVLVMLMMGSLLVTSCEGEDGVDGIDGINGIDGTDGIDAEGVLVAVQGELPEGFTENIWNSFDIEDRRSNTNPGDIGVGNAQLVRDENKHFFVELSSFNTSDPDDTEYYVFSTVAGAALDTQNDFEEDERPRMIMDIDGTAPFTVTKGDDQMFIPLTTPPGPASSGRMFDWVVLYPAGTTDFSAPGIVADLDAGNLLPRLQIWNEFEIEDRTAQDQDATSVTATNGYARLITNEDQGRSRFWINLTDFQGVDQPIERGNGNITATSFAVFLTVAGADLNTQGGFDESERPVFIGILEENGAQYVPLLEGDVANLDAVNGRGIEFNLNNGGVNLNEDGYITPQRATGGSNRWYDWVVLMPIDADGVRPTSYAGFAADLDATNELAQNQ